MVFKVEVVLPFQNNITNTTMEMLTTRCNIPENMAPSESSCGIQ